MDDLIGASAGGYTLRRMIGEGAFGCVYEGVHSQSNERRAFKVARREMGHGGGEEIPAAFDFVGDLR